MGEEVKVGYELAVAGWLVEQLRREGQSLSDPVAGDIHRREPDAVCETNGGRIGIEVSSAYYSDDEARNIWAMARGTPERSSRYLAPGMDPREFARRLPVLHNFTDQLVTSLHSVIGDHCRKTYSLPTYLVVDVTHAALTTAEGASEVLDEIHVPAECPFAAVYVAFTKNWSNEVVLFPVWTCPERQP